MSDPLTPSPNSPSPSLGDRPCCQACGGSGVLRINHNRFRTCLDCLGQGVLPQFSTSPELSRLLSGPSQADPVAPEVMGEAEVSAGAWQVASR